MLADDELDHLHLGSSSPAPRESLLQPALTAVTLAGALTKRSWRSGCFYEHSRDHYYRTILGLSYCASFLLLGNPCCRVHLSCRVSSLPVSPFMRRRDRT